MPRTHTGSRTNGLGDRARRSPVESCIFYSTGLGRRRVRPRARLLKKIQVATFLLTLLFTPALLANGYPTLHWLGANGTSWTAPNNWSSDSSGSSPTDFSPNAYTIFSATGSANSSATNLSGDQTVSSLTISVPDPVGLGGGTLTVNGPDDTGQGRWIPTTSVDEYAATLATWFGVSPTDLPTVLPNIGRFAKPNLGFLS